MKRNDKIRASTKETRALLGFPENQVLSERGRLFLVEKSDSARIEAVIATDYLHVAGINLSLENWRVRT